ncbi:MAG: arylesterase [Rhodobacteraceae bacterium]|nr:arylesterase [Paracoccaceae bacterium]
MSVIQTILQAAASQAYGAARAIGNRCTAALAALTLLLAIPVGAASEPLRLVALGDSLTQGYGLPSDDGFVPQLQGWLQGQGLDVEVINAGVSGDTTAGGLSRMDWTLAEPVDAMLVILGGNDLLRGINPEASRENLDGILSRLGREGIPAMLAGLPAPGNYGPEFQRAFDRMYIDLAGIHDVRLYPDFMQPLSDKAEAGQSFSDLMQDDHIHPNADGVALIVQGIGPEVQAFLEQVLEERA